LKLSTLRKIDYWLGIPICGLLDIVSLFIDPFRQKKKNPKNILFIELSEAGSLIIAYSAIKRLKDSAPDANIYFMIFKRHVDGLNLLKIIDEDKILGIRDDNMVNFATDVLLAIKKIWASRIDTVVDMELFSRATSILTFMAFASNRVGFFGYTGEGLYRGILIHNYKVVYNAYKHMSLNFLALVDSLLSQNENEPLLKRELTDKMVTPLKLPKTREAEQNGMEIVRSRFPSLSDSHKLIIFNPNAGELPIRAWPLENYISVANSLLEDDENAVVLIIGLPDAINDGEQMEKEVNSERLVNLIGVTKTLGDVVDLCHISKLILTNDAGPAQYAALTDTSVVVFFGPETPLLYRPLGDKVYPQYSNFSCSPCLTAANHRNTSCRDNQCIKTIPVEKVTKLCKKIL